jgi:protein RecA
MASAEDISKALDGIIGSNDESTTVTHWLDSGFPPLNDASASDWEKGFPVGRMIEIAGPPSSGKTAIATKVMAAAQKAGGIAGFMDHERSFSLDLAPRLGLDITPGRFIFKKPKTFEQSLQMAALAAKTIRDKKLIHKDAPIVFVFDSLASMVPMSALFDAKGNLKSLEDRNMNDNTALARATSNAFPAFAQFCEEYGVLAIFLNQMRTKIGVMFGDPRKTTGGNAPEFYFSQRLWLSSSQIKAKVNGKDEIIGVEVTGKFVKNKIARPFKEAKWRFMFQKDGTGRFDVERSMIEFLEGIGALEKATGPGKVIYDGKTIGKETLARQLEISGKVTDLNKLLPAKYEPETVASVEMDETE